MLRSDRSSNRMRRVNRSSCKHLGRHHPHRYAGSVHYKGHRLVGDEPGLQSVASATATPSSIIFRALAGCSIRKKAVAGNSTAMIIASQLPIFFVRCLQRRSAETAPSTLTASSAPPVYTISSAWIFGLKAILFASFKYSFGLLDRKYLIFAKYVAELSQIFWLRAVSFHRL